MPEADRAAAAEALADIASLGPFFTVVVGGAAEGWHPVADTYRRGFTDLVERTAARYETGELRVGASIVQLGHAARLWSPVLGCAVVHGIVPDLTGLQRADNGPALRLPTAAGFPAATGPELAAQLYDVVLRQHLDPLAAGLRVKVAPRLLAGNAASALVGSAQALLASRPDLRTPVTALTTELLNTGQLRGTGDLRPYDLRFKRRSCCLFYRTPGGGKCGDCSLL
ncbi:(2Fe-2S)-binding protein [Streptomyces boninensis]|uniref:(2Fe-2S)-binding protein n=1 Tax=Streptomyces boninensis TaxID=2039455 RepID=UPI003B217F53